MARKTATIHEALQGFAAAVTGKMAQFTPGPPEPSARRP
jgi:hypothetical protein